MSKKVPEIKPIRVRYQMLGESFPFTIFYSDYSTRSFTKKCDETTANEILQKIENRIANNTFDLKDFTHKTGGRSNQSERSRSGVGTTLRLRRKH